jgi:hypothetical protein
MHPDLRPCCRSPSQIGEGDAPTQFHRSVAGLSVPVRAREFCHGGSTAKAREYNPTMIRLIGARVVIEGTEDEYLQAWSNNRRGEREALRRLDALIGAHPGLPLVTWSGENADIPRLWAAMRGLPDGGRSLNNLSRARHVDLYRYVMRSVHLPVAKASLKQIAAYFDIPRRTYSGDVAARVRDRNRDDLDALVGIARGLRELGRH